MTTTLTIILLLRMKTLITMALKPITSADRVLGRNWQ